jgi:hypothetical protein
MYAGRRSVIRPLPRAVSEMPAAETAKADVMDVLAGQPKLP